MRTRSTITNNHTYFWGNSFYCWTQLLTLNTGLTVQPVSYLPKKSSWSTTPLFCCMLFPLPSLNIYSSIQHFFHVLAAENNLHLSFSLPVHSYRISPFEKHTIQGHKRQQLIIICSKSVINNYCLTILIPFLPLTWSLNVVFHVNWPHCNKFSTLLNKT